MCVCVCVCVSECEREREVYGPDSAGIVHSMSGLCGSLHDVLQLLPNRPSVIEILPRECIHPHLSVLELLLSSLQCAGEATELGLGYCLHQLVQLCYQLHI